MSTSLNTELNTTIRSAAMVNSTQADKELNNDIITNMQLELSQKLFTPSQVLGFGVFGQETAQKMVDLLNAHSLQMTYSDKTRKFTVLESSKLSKASIERIFSDDDYMGWRPEVLDEVDQNGNWLVGLVTVVPPFSQMSRTSGAVFTGDVSSEQSGKLEALEEAKELNSREIAEIFFGEAGFTNAKDRKPILATCECVFGVALGGYERTNKIAFLIHLLSVEQLKNSGDLIFENIYKLGKEKIKQPIELHLRGGVKNQSEEIIAAIKTWMKQRKDLPMEIKTLDILSDFELTLQKSLLIDSRTGTVSDYDFLDNPHFGRTRRLNAFNSRARSGSIQKIELIYTPK